MSKNLKELHIGIPDAWKRFNASRKKQVQGLLTGYPEIDEQVNGLTGIVGFQGEPKACKSTLLMNIAAYNASQGIPTLMIDRENGETRLKTRVICAQFELCKEEVRAAADEAARGWYKELASWPFYVETEECPIEQVGEYLKELREAYPTGPLLLIVDSLQALPQGERDERQAIEGWLKGFDQFKLDFKDDLTIFVTIEKSKGTWGESKRDSGKGTGAIGYKCEQLFNMILDEESDNVHVDMLYNRDGETFKGAWFKKHFKRGSGYTYRLDFGGWMGDDEL